MIIFWPGKVMYTIADKIRSDKKSYGRIENILGCMLLAAIFPMYFKVFGPGNEGWLKWLSDLGIKGVITRALILLLILGGIGILLEKFLDWVFEYKLNRICSKHYPAARSYDLFMLARVPVEKPNKGGTAAPGRKGPDPQVNIEYFLKQEKKKKMYNATGIKRI